MPRKRHGTSRRRKYKVNQEGGMGLLNLIKLNAPSKGTNRQFKTLDTRFKNFVQREALRYAPAAKKYAKSALQRELPRLKNSIGRHIVKDVAPRAAKKVLLPIGKGLAQLAIEAIF